MELAFSIFSETVELREGKDGHSVVLSRLSWYVLLEAGMCTNPMHGQGATEKFFFSYFVPTDTTPLGGGFAHCKEELDSYDEAFVKALTVAGIKYSWGTVVDSKGEIVLSFGKPEH